MNKQNIESRSKLITAPCTLSKILVTFLALCVWLSSGPLQFACAQPAAKISAPPPAKPAHIKTGPKRSLPPKRPDHFSPNPSDTELMLSGFFKEPLVPIKASSKPNENQSLAKSLDTYRSNKEIANVAPLADFLKSNPESRWTPALELNVGTIRFESVPFL